MRYQEDEFDEYLETDDGSDDESYDDDEGSAEFLGRVLGALTPPIIPAVGSAVGSAIFGPRQPRPPLPPLPLPVGGSGVGSAVLNTPRGQATIRLPEKVVSHEEFTKTVEQIKDGLNRNTERLNTTQRDLQALSTKADAAAVSARTEIGKVRKDVARAQKAQKAAFARLRRQQSQQSTTNMLIPLLMQRSLQTRIDEVAAATHTHNVTMGTAGQTATTTPAAVTTGTSSSDKSSLLLPLLFMMPGGFGGSQDGGSGSGSSGDNSMMMMMMMMTLFD